MTRATRAGFSLVEMLVVIVIITVLFAIVIGSVERVQDYSRRSETLGRLHSMAQAITAYRDDWGDVPGYNPTYVDLNGDGNFGAGNEPHGIGLWALVMLDYVSNYRYLNDAAAQAPAPWILAQDGVTRLEVTPGDPTSMEAAHVEWYGAITTPGGDLTPQEEYRVYNLLATPAWHNAGGVAPTDHGAFANYDDESYENWCSWMMRDPYSGEWKYQPVRRTLPAGTAEPLPTAGGFPVDDSTDPDHYHRQLSHRWTDHDAPGYLSASDTVVTWSNLFRQIERQPAYSVDDWGLDLVLYADGHVATLPGPFGDVATDWQNGRATQRPPQR